MARTSFHNRKVWLTGASSGIGRALALELLRRGARVAMTSRRSEPLAEIAAEANAGDRALIATADLTSRQANHDAVAQIEKAWGGLDVVILNAGTCEYVDIRNFDASIFESTMQTNFISMAYGVEAALPLLRQSQTPHLAGMSSTVAYTGLPTAEAYGASKAAIRALFESLSLDLKPLGVPVSVICPGFVKTPLTDRNEFPMPMMISAERAARIIADGIERGRFEIHFPLRFSLIMKLVASFPEPLRQIALKGTVKKS